VGGRRIFTLTFALEEKDYIRSGGRGGKRRGGRVEIEYRTRAMGSIWAWIVEGKKGETKMVVALKGWGKSVKSSPRGENWAQKRGEGRSTKGGTMRSSTW